MKNIYLDHAAATPVDDRVRGAMETYWADNFYNPSSIYRGGVEARKALDKARATIAGLLAVRPSELVFTAGATEANNLAIQGVASQYPGSHLIASGLEHDSVIAPMNYLAQKGHSLSLVDPRSTGIVEPKDVVDSITDQTLLVSVMLANNEIGTIQPIREISTLINRVRTERKARGVDTPLFLHTDAAQAGNYLALDPHRLGVDLMTVNSGKLYGPKQVGLLFVRAGVNIQPLIHGGGQERGLRSGTENVAGAVGFAVALDIASTMRKSESPRLHAIQYESIKLLTSTLPRIVINGSTSQRLPNNIHLTVPGNDNERLLFELDRRNIFVATGSACHASQTANHVLESLGLNSSANKSSLRISMGRATELSDMKYLVGVLETLVL